MRRTIANRAAESADGPRLMCRKSNPALRALTAWERAGPVYETVCTSNPEQRNCDWEAASEIQYVD
eukprot:4496609-Alexandrium_andersonii.AAC.1